MHRRIALVPFTALFLVASARAEGPYAIEEPDTDTRVRRVAAEVRTSGAFHFNAPGETISHDVEAVAAFQFLERRLPPGGREAQALRAVREFDLARAHVTVGRSESDLHLPAERRLVVAEGRREGVRCYSPEGRMSRDAVELLNIAGDPLALTALLPRRPVEVGEEWSPSDWAGQMLCTLEAVETANLTCTLASVEGRVARVEFTGRVTGQRHGADTEVDVTGHCLYDTQQRLIRTAELTYTIKASIGTIDPGMDATVEVTLQRALADSPGRLTDATAARVPLQPSAEALHLSFGASAWGIEFAHDRDWYVFHAQLEGNPKLVILRLMHQGSLICQCNLSPIPSAPAGRHASLEQFESDIAETLSGSLERIAARERIPVEDGRKLFRFVAEGKLQVAGDAGAVEIPMNWIYYLIAAPSGKQVSCVFAVEPAYLEMLAERDVDLVKSITFTDE